MEQYIIKGGNPLVGEVEIGGAKNAALAILAAAIMTDETVTIDNLPDVNDINVLLEAISGIGAEVDRIDRHTVRINGSNIENFDIEYDYIKKIRASYYLLGALLGKYKRAEVASGRMQYRKPSNRPASERFSCAWCLCGYRAWQDYRRSRASDRKAHLF